MNALNRKQRLGAVIDTLQHAAAQLDMMKLIDNEPLDAVAFREELIQLVTNCIRHADNWLQYERNKLA